MKNEQSQGALSSSLKERDHQHSTDWGEPCSTQAGLAQPSPQPGRQNLHHSAVESEQGQAHAWKANPDRDVEEVERNPHLPITGWKDPGCSQ